MEHYVLYKFSCVRSSHDLCAHTHAQLRGNIDATVYLHQQQSDYYELIVFTVFFQSRVIVASVFQLVQHTTVEEDVL